MDDNARELYASIGAVPVINALGARTLLGGSEPHPEVVETMRIAGRYYVDMDQLLQTSGQTIAQMLSCPSALVTPGCAAALVLGTAACITGDDPAKMAQLPNLNGLKNEVVIQRAQRYKYDRVVRMTGVDIIAAGRPEGTSAEELERTLTPQTAAVLYADIDAPGDLLSVEETIAIAHRHNIPVIVDCAYRVYPLDGLKKYAEMGADLWGYGAKYFGAPNSTGLLCGRSDLVAAARLHSFAGFEKYDLLGFGRPFKVDRQEVFGVIIALRRWLDLDHDARFAAARRRAETLKQLLSEMKGLASALTTSGLSLSVEANHVDINAETIAQRLKDGNPSIWLDATPTGLHADMLAVHDGDETEIAARLKEILAP